MFVCFFHIVLYHALAICGVKELGLARKPQFCDAVTRLGNYKGALPFFHLLMVSSQAG